MPPGDLRGSVLGTGLNVFLLGQGVFVPPPTIVYTPIAHVTERIMFGLFLREPTYAAAPEWTTAGCRMTDYDHNSAHAVWDDIVEDDHTFLHGAEYSVQHDRVRQSVRLPYAEPRAHPNSLGGLLTLTLGQRITTQDGALQAYRHALTLVGSNVSLSMAAQVAHPPGLQYVYTGLKAEHFVLRNNGPFLHLGCEMIGSGIRALAAEEFPLSVQDPWLLWGDCHIWLKDVTGLPLSVPGVPAQGATNLGSGALDISTRLVRLEYFQPCHLWADGGYRPSSGMVRASLYPARREAGIVLQMDIENATEAAEVDWYLQQRRLAFEWQCVGQLIAPGGTYRYGFSLLLPAVQFRRLRFGEQDAVDTFEFEGVVVDDTVNAGVLAWVYTSEPEYLGTGAVVVLECGLVPDGLVACWEMNEASGDRLAHVGGPTNTLVPRNAPLGVPGYAETAVRFATASQQYLYNSTDSPLAIIAAFTIIFRVRPTSTPTATAGLITNGNTTQSGGYDFLVLALTGSASVLVSFGGGGGGVIVSSAPLIVGQWNLVKIWRTFSPDPNVLSLQINANTIDTVTGFLPPGTITMQRFNIGATGGSGGAAFDYFDGDIDTVAFWNRALTAPERALFPV